MISNKDILVRAVKSLRCADCYLNELTFVNKIVSAFGLWGLANQMRCKLIPRPHETTKLLGWTKVWPWKHDEPPEACCHAMATDSSEDGQIGTSYLKLHSTSQHPVLPSEANSRLVLRAQHHSPRWKQLHFVKAFKDEEKPVLGGYGDLALILSLPLVLYPTFCYLTQINPVFPRLCIPPPFPLTRAGIVLATVFLFQQQRRKKLQTFSNRPSTPKQNARTKLLQMSSQHLQPGCWWRATAEERSRKGIHTVC